MSSIFELVQWKIVSCLELFYAECLGCVTKGVLMRSRFITRSKFNTSTHFQNSFSDDKKCLRYLSFSDNHSIGRHFRDCALSAQLLSLLIGHFVKCPEFLKANLNSTTFERWDRTRCPRVSGRATREAEVVTRWRLSPLFTA